MKQSYYFISSPNAFKRVNYHENALEYADFASSLSICGPRRTLVVGADDAL